MNTETDYLQSIADEIYINKSTEESKPNHHLKTEAKRLEKAIIHSLSTIENFTQRDTFYFNTLSRLVNICDTLFDVSQTVNPNVNILIELLTAVKQVIPDEVRPNLKLPKAFIAMQKEHLVIYWADQCQRMQQQNIPEKLIAIAAIPFQRFIEPNIPCTGAISPG